MSEQRVWVIGRSGLLGSALARLHGADTFPGSRIPWRDPNAVAALDEDLGRFLAQLPVGARWTVYWAAGSGAIGSAPGTLRQESIVLSGFLDAIRRRVTTDEGAFFYSSSASVYGGSTGPPFTESTPAVPLNAYAAAKHEQETLVSAALSNRMPHVIGRISTLFGPGQDLSKGQGLVSRLCLQAARRQPVSLFVPIDTLRDYIQVNDAAEVIRRFVVAAQASADSTTRIRIVARGESMTIAELASRVRAVGHRRIGISQAAIAPRSAHVRDLRVRTEFEHELAGVRWSSIAAGIQAVQADILRQINRGNLASETERSG